MSLDTFQVWEVGCCAGQGSGLKDLGMGTFLLGCNLLMVRRVVDDYLRWLADLFQADLVSEGF